MGQTGSAPSIPRADFGSDGSGSGATLPFSSRETDTPAASQIVCLIQVASNDAEIVRQTIGLIQRQLAGQKVGSRGIAVIVSDETCEMSITTKQNLAAQIAPMVAAALGVPNIGV